MMYVKPIYAFLALAMWCGVKVTHSDDEWRAILGRERYCVMRKKATERAFSGQYLYVKANGVYHCAACDLALFHTSQQFNGKTGWSCFHEPIIQNHIWIKEDRSLPFLRYEVLCRSCDSHLGHVFREDPQILRYTINSIAITFEGEK
jgi:peptide-methionine (R)-S-oxide reductase